jgi:hypothetical protein
MRDSGRAVESSQLFLQASRHLDANLFTAHRAHAQDRAGPRLRAFPEGVEKELHGLSVGVAEELASTFVAYCPPGP